LSCTIANAPKITFHRSASHHHKKKQAKNQANREIGLIQKMQNKTRAEGAADYRLLPYDACYRHSMFTVYNTHDNDEKLTS
jgi:hypothetical protein